MILLLIFYSSITVWLTQIGYDFLKRSLESTLGQWTDPDIAEDNQPLSLASSEEQPDSGNWEGNTIPSQQATAPGRHAFSELELGHLDSSPERNISKPELPQHEAVLKKECWIILPSFFEKARRIFLKSFHWDWPISIRYASIDLGFSHSPKPSLVQRASVSWQNFRAIMQSFFNTARRDWARPWARPPWSAKDSWEQWFVSMISDTEKNFQNHAQNDVNDPSARKIFDFTSPTIQNPSQMFIL